MVSAQEVAIVTGAAGGLGRAVARKLASRGISILIADVQEERGKETAESIRQGFGVESIFCKTDVTKEEDVKRMVQTAVERWGRLDWAANNAGMGEKLEDNEDDVTTEAFNKLYEINQRGVWLCQKYEAEQMRKQEPRLANGTTPEPGGVLNEEPSSTLRLFAGTSQQTCHLIQHLSMLF